MERQTRIYGRFLTSAQAVSAYATVVLVIAAIDVATRAALDPFTKIKLGAWMLGAFLLTLRIVRVLKRVDELGREWNDAEKLLFQIATLMPIVGIIPLAFM